MGAKQFHAGRRTGGQPNGRTDERMDRRSAGMAKETIAFRKFA